MSEEIEKVDHGQQALERIVSRYDSADTFQALLSALVDEIDELEQVGVDLIYKRLLDAAEGDQLDQWSSMLNEPRRGMGDTDYRRFIDAKILGVTSQGNPDRMIEIVERLTLSTELDYREAYPCYFELSYVKNPSISDPPVSLTEIIQDATPAGFLCGGVVGGSEKPFMFGSVGEPDPTFGGGFAAVNDTTDAGEFAKVM